MNKSIFGLNQNLAAALSYLLGPVTGLIFYIGEKTTNNDNKYVQFHALQSIILFGGIMVVQFILGLVWIPVITRLLLSIINLGTLVAAIYLMYTAFTGKTFKIPVIGDTCWNQVYGK